MIFRTISRQTFFELITALTGEYADWDIVRIIRPEDDGVFPSAMLIKYS